MLPPHLWHFQLPDVQAKWLAIVNLWKKETIWIVISSYRIDLRAISYADLKNSNAKFKWHKLKPYNQKKKLAMELLRGFRFNITIS